MTRSQPPDPPAPGERPPPWMGAPGYTPYGDNLPPHAPMPGAPPYPPAVGHPPPPIGRPAARTGFGPALAAAAIWAAVNVVLVVALGPANLDVARFLGQVMVPALIAALIVWLIVRRRAISFVLLVLLAAPFYWLLRVVSTVSGG